MPESNSPETILQGIAASSGVAHGAFVLVKRDEVEIQEYAVAPDKEKDEIERFKQAIEKTRQEIEATRKEIEKKLGSKEASIFEAHLMLVDDKKFHEDVLATFQKTHVNIEQCVKRVFNGYRQLFGQFEVEHFRDKVLDLKDVYTRLMAQLTGKEANPFAHIEGKKILITKDLVPSDSAKLEKGNVLGIITASGGHAGHAVMIASSLAVPAVVGLVDIADQVKEDDYLLIDGNEGIVITNPSQETLKHYERIKLARKTARSTFTSTLDLPAQTRDGGSVELMANLSDPEEIEAVKQSGCAGIGLFRTETLYLRENRFPEEDEQFLVYKKVVQAITPNPVVIRTLDIGGDKQMALGLYSRERNPFMGLRGIRFCLRHKAVFRDQLRAILRASAFGKVRLMLPMISGLGELLEARSQIESAKKSLREDGYAFDESIRIGIMIEVPSAAYTADLLADHCDFFSVGTNDLIQYLLATDRLNEQVAYLHEANHPAVLRILKHVLDVAHKKKIPVSLCGEIAGNALYTPFFVGLGFHALSMTPNALPEIKYLIRRLQAKEVEDIVKRSLKQAHPQEVFSILKAFYFSKMDIATSS